MPKYTHFAIVASFFCLWLNSFFTEKTELIIAFFFILTVGILHGANDLILIETTNSDQKTSTFLKNLIKYIIIVVSGLVLFYLLPILALALFIIVSAFHFGDQQGLYFSFKTSKIILVAYPFLYGVLLLFLLFYFNSLEVENIVSAIIRIPIPYFYITEILITTLLLFSSISIYFFYKFRPFRNRVILYYCFCHPL